MNERHVGNLELLGGRLCLDLANTVSTRIESLRREYLLSYEDLVAWSRHTAILTPGEAEILLAKAARQPGRAAAVLRRAITLREAMYRTFSAIAGGRRVEPADLVAINQELGHALSHLQIAAAQNKFEWAWATNGDGLERMLWSVARSAAELLTSADLFRVRECAREGCDWLFVDTSKNHSRRWCSMEVCGSRIKSQRYYRRQKTRIASAGRG